MGEKKKKILLQWKMQEERFVSGNAEQSYSGFKIKKTNRALQSILIVVKHESGSRQIAVTHHQL